MLTVLQSLDMDSRDLPIDMARERSAFELHQEMRNAMGMTGAKSSRRPPHKTTEAQKRKLLIEFEKDPNPPADRRDELARELNVERRIIKNWFSNQRALRRKTGQGYRGWIKSPTASDDDREYDMDNREDGEDSFPRVASAPSPPSHTDTSSRGSSYPPSPPPLSPPQLSHRKLDPFTSRMLLPKPIIHTPSNYYYDPIIDGPQSHSVISPFRPSAYITSSYPSYSTVSLYPPTGFSRSISGFLSQDDMDTDSDPDEVNPSPCVYPTSAVRSTQNNNC